MPDINNKTITIELSSEETIILAEALMGHMIHLKHWLPAYRDDLLVIAGISREIHNLLEEQTQEPADKCKPSKLEHRLQELIDMAEEIFISSVTYKEK